MSDQGRGNKKIALIGASSQIGASIALYFKKFDKAEPVCFLRSTYSEPFFKLLDIKTEIIDLYNGELEEKLSGFDAVLDFTYPSGQAYEQPKKIKDLCSTIISSMPENAVYIYMSSIMAFGMPDLCGKIEHYHVPRGTYGLIKRKAESYVRKYGKKYRIKVYNLRLGQVHGFLQSVNSSFRRQFIQNQTLFVGSEKSSLTNTIFISSLGTAIMECVNRKHAPGIYTMASSPQWTIEELYSYYKKYYQFSNILDFNARSEIGERKTLKSRMMDLLKGFKPLLESYILMKFPNLSLKVKGIYRANETRAQITSKPIRAIDYHILGELKYKSITVDNSDFESVFSIEKEMDAHFNTLIEAKKYE